MIKQPNRTCITSVQFEPDGDVITADSDGFISIYSVDAEGMYFIRMEFEAHIKDIGCLLMLSDGTLLSGGEKDRKIAAWDSLQNYKPISDTKLPETAGGIRTIFPQRPGRDDGNIYVGTTRNNIVEGSLQRRFNEVIFGHGRQLWGLAVHPEDEIFATAGMDKMIVLWRKHKLIWSSQVEYECISLAFHPYGSALAVGTTAGHLLVLNSESGEINTTVRVCAAPLNCIGFNQGELFLDGHLASIRIAIFNIVNRLTSVGDMIAMGSENGSIYLFRVTRDGFTYKRQSKIRGTQPIQHLDWSLDGFFLQTVTVDFDLLFCEFFVARSFSCPQLTFKLFQFQSLTGDTRSLSPERSAILMRDTKWLSHNCTVGFLVAGMWNNRYYSTGSTKITTCNRSSSGDLLASGDAEGHVRLFK